MPISDYVFSTCACAYISVAFRSFLILVMVAMENGIAVSECMNFY